MRRSLATFTLLSLLCWGCGGIEQATCAPEGVEVPPDIAREFPQHARFVSLLDEIVTLGQHEDGAIAGAVTIEQRLASLDRSEIVLGTVLRKLEDGMSPERRARWEATMGPFVARAHQRLDTMLAEMAAEEPVAAQIVAEAVHRWLAGTDAGY